MTKQKAFILIIVLSLLSFLGGGMWTYLLSSDVSREVYRNLQLFAKVYDLVKRNYVEEPKDRELVEGAIRGMLERLDSHSMYMSKSDFEQMQEDTKGEFGGLGIEIIKKEGQLTVITPIEDSPAFQAGIKPGDIIAKIEDQLTERMNIFEAVNLMRGLPGTIVNIFIRRQGVENLIPFKIKRDIIKIKSVVAKMVEKFPVIKIKQFVENSAPEMKERLKQLSKEQSIPGLVLDLRNNPGGLLQQAIEVADVFLKEGLIVYTQGRDQLKVDKKFSVSKGTEPDYPMVVLINGGSASASEIVAGALQDHKRARVMGTQSFGKGSVQNVIPLDDGGGVKLTVALYYTPQGRTIQGVGISPDEIVQALDGNDALVREKDLPGHLVGKHEVKEKEEKKTAPHQKNVVNKTTLTPFEKEDYQLARAIAYLKTRVTKLAEKSQ